MVHKDFPINDTQTVENVYKHSETHRLFRDQASFVVG